MQAPMIPLLPVHRALSVAALGLALAGNAMAETQMPVTPTGPWMATAPQQVMLLAQALTPPLADGTARTTREGSSEAVDAPWYGRNNIHKYLGLASLASAAVTMIAPKKFGGPHEAFAEAAAAFGGAAVVSGVYSHWDDINMNWSDPDTKHAVLGTLGTLGYLLAVSRGGEGGHAGAGALGALSMITAIKYTW